MDWTIPQKQAIDLEGKNILVSAGAGSGKTAVLTARVIRKLHSGIHIHQLLILTFTNAAAAGMKEKIRKAISKDPNLKEEADLLDSAYIMTFDAFSLAMVKKYHTILNITDQIKVCDEVFISMKKREILDQIFEENYFSPKKDFIQLIQDFCLKDDKELKEAILNLYKKIELKFDKEDYLKEYLSNWMSNEKIDSFVSEYVSLLVEKQGYLKESIDRLGEYFDGDFVSKVEDNFKNLLNARSYDEFLKGIEYQSITVPRGSSEEGKKLKKTIFDLASSMKDLCIYESIEEMKEEIFSTKSNVTCIIRLLEEFDKRLEEYKFKNELFTFTDISRMAIRVVMENKDVLEEVKGQFQEILVDEYQDTSDIQEMFISLISKDNVYMVGDIKQSIYRFRNANPYLFKNKYDSYEKKEGGEKIDLLDNFRSREEVLSDINLLFDMVMDDELGGANYRKSHRMVFGNQAYHQKGKTDQNYHLDVLTYDKTKLGKLTMAEEEAFLIGQDILNKMKEKAVVFEADEQILRPVEFRDFVILLDRSHDFDLYKKIFESLKIPFSILKEESLKKEDDIFVLNSLFRFLICMREERYDLEFRYTFVSLARSFLVALSDEEIYDIFIHNRFMETELYRKCLPFVECMDSMNLSQFFLKLLKEFHYEEKLLTIGRVKAYRVREEYLYHLCEDYEAKGYTIYDFADYLTNIFENDYDLTFNLEEDVSNSVKILTIHKSKGLEYPICYYAGLSSSFNLSELRERILFDNHFGIILPKVEDFYKDTILKTLLKQKTKREEISEKIRLFYVAVTRAKEKMIMVLPRQEEEEEVFDVVPLFQREKYSSFLSILKSIYSCLLPYIHECEIIGSKEYLKNIGKKEIHLSSSKPLKVEEISIPTSIVSQKHYSKTPSLEISEEEKNMMQYGSRIHEILEEIDFLDVDLSFYEVDEFMKKKIYAFLESSLLKKYLSYPMYKEYEFLSQENGNVFHGIVDLLIECEDQLIIIDYKLKNIEEEAYDIQLNGYRNFFEKKTGKKVQCYLYSLLDEKYREINS